MGFATGTITGLATWRSHKSWTAVFAQSIGMSIFVAGLMTAGSLISVFGPLEQAKFRMAYVRNFDLVGGRRFVDKEPYWLLDAEDSDSDDN